MNSKTLVVLLIILIFLLSIIFRNNIKHNIKINDLGSIENNGNYKLNKKDTERKKILKKPMVNKSIIEKSNDAIKNELTYLQAYRNKKFFNTCFWKLHDYQNNVDPLEKFRTNIIEKRRGTALGGGGLQEKYFMDHFNKCKEFLGDKENDIGEVSKNLDELFHSLKPITNEEKDLSAYLNLLTERKDIVSRIYAEKKGNKSDETLLKLNQSLEEVLYKLIKNLKTNTSPDVFIDNHYNYLDSLRNPFDSIPRLEDLILKNIQNNTNINDKQYLEILIDLATPLFACSLGYPCDENSLVVYKHCIYLYNKNACGRSVEDFYLNDLTSPNMQNDLNKILGYFMKNYAQI